MSKTSSRGASLQIEDDATPGQYTDIAQLKSFGDLTLTSSEIDVTTLDSVGSYKDYLQGFKDSGEVAFTCVFDPDQHFTGPTALLTLYNSGDVKNFRIYLPFKPDPWGFTFAGYIKQFKIAAQTPESAIEGGGSVRISGAVTGAKVVGGTTAATRPVGGLGAPLSGPIVGTPTQPGQTQPGQAYTAPPPVPHNR